MTHPREIDSIVQNSVVLIVDDIPKNLELLAEILSRDGFQVAVAANAPQALTIAATKPPDLILMDVNMPGMDGFTACERLKSDPATRGIPIIFLTARNEEEDILRGFELGGADYVTKPFRGTELLARVRTHLELAQSRKLILVQNEELREMNLAKDKLFSILAHDMKNPLTAFREISDLLLSKEDQLDDERKKDLIATIQQAAEKLLALLENVFVWSQSQSGRLQYAPLQHPLFPTIQETFSLFAANIKNKNLNMSATVPEDLSAYHDPNLLRTILRNLVGNAIKYTPEGGVITVAARERDNFLEISVSDTGSGLRTVAPEKLFTGSSEHLYHGRKEEKGTGLGLVLCKEFVERHGGLIWVESEKQKGCTFRFTLPKSRDTAAV